MKKGTKLTPKQELFCKIYATDREFFGNGTQSYIQAYNPNRTSKNWYRAAQSSASDLLSNPMIFNRINELLEEGGFNNVAVDKQISFLIHQQADLSVKIAAIREYNKLKSRIENKIELTLPEPIYGGRAKKTVQDS